MNTIRHFVRSEGLRRRSNQLSLADAGSSRFINVSLILLALGLTDPVFGQEASAAIEEIVVTAQKREQSLQDVPVSLSVYSQDAITKLNAGDFADFADTVPGLGFATLGAGSSNYIIRGIGQVGLGASPTTGVYLDEVPLQTRTGRGASLPDPRLFDVARVEVLRGPQGVIFGSSAMGGMVRIVTNQPDSGQFESLVDVGVSSIDGGSESWDVKAMANIPLVNDVLAFRISGTVGVDGGWIDEVRAVTADLFENVDDPAAIREDMNSADYQMVRAALAYTPDDSLTITPSLLYQKTEQDFDRAHADETFGFESERRARYQDTFVDVELLSANVSVEKDFDFAGGVSILSSTSFLDWTFANQFDTTVFRSEQIESIVGPSPNGQLYWSGSNNNTNTQQFTQEVRLTSTSDSQWQYITGVYFNDINQDDRQSRPTNNLFGVTAPLPFGASSTPQLEEIFTNFEQQEFALFGEISYKPIDEWTISVGGRLFRYEQEDSRRRFGVGGEAGGVLDFQFTDENDENGFIPRLVVAYQPNDNINIYSSYSVGFRTGGINEPFSDDTCTQAERDAAGLPASPPPYESDSTKNLELGTKTSWLDRRIRISAAVYSIDWEDFQQFVVIPCGPQNQFVESFTANAGAVESQGAEVEFSFELHESFVVTGGGSYTDAVYKQAFTTLGLAAGSSLLDVPKVTGNIRGDYYFPLGQRWHGNVMVSAKYVDDTASGFGEGVPLLRPSYTIVDLMARAELDSLSISLFVDNITDETPIYAQEFAANPFSTNATSFFAAVVGQPRTIGVRLSKQFE